MEILGPPPLSLLGEAPRANLFFTGGRAWVYAEKGRCAHAMG